MVENYKIILIIFILLLQTGCLSNPVVPDHSCDKNIAIELSDIDYLLFANHLVDELTASNAVTKLAAKSRLNVYVDKLENNTSEAINIEHVELTIQNRLKRSAKINLKENPGKADYLLTGGFIENTVDCNEQINKFTLILKSTSIKKIIWSQSKTYKH